MWWRFGRRCGHFSGGLKTLVLYLLRGQPKTGMDVINSVEEMTLGFWRPSPGSVYPLLKRMVGEGLLETVEINGRQAYRLTERGRRELESHLGHDLAWRPGPRTLKEALGELEANIEYIVDMVASGERLEEGEKERIRRLVDRLEAVIR